MGHLGFITWLPGNLRNILPYPYSVEERITGFSFPESLSRIFLVSLASNGFPLLAVIEPTAMEWAASLSFRPVTLQGSGGHQMKMRLLKTGLFLRRGEVNTGEAMCINTVITKCHQLSNV